MIVTVSNEQLQSHFAKVCERLSLFDEQYEQLLREEQRIREDMLARDAKQWKITQILFGKHSDNYDDRYITSMRRSWNRDEKAKLQNYCQTLLKMIDSNLDQYTFDMKE